MLFRRAVAAARCGRLFATQSEIIVPAPAPPGYSSVTAGATANIVVASRELSTIWSLAHDGSGVQWTLSSQLQSDFQFERPADAFFQPHDVTQARAARAARGARRAARGVQRLAVLVVLAPFERSREQLTHSSGSSGSLARAHARVLVRSSRTATCS